jgi:hypothetical protein
VLESGGPDYLNECDWGGLWYWSFVRGYWWRWKCWMHRLRVCFTYYNIPLGKGSAMTSPADGFHKAILLILILLCTRSSVGNHTFPWAEETL